MPAPNNQAVIQAAFECFAKGDIDGILAKLTDDVIWEGPDNSDLPYSGTFRGKSRVKEFFSGVGQIEVASFEPQEFFNVGNNVIVIGRWGGKVRKSGKSFQSNWVFVFELADGKIRRLRDFQDTATTAAAFRTA
jgi:ketosteroid isomerase-like protein